VLLSCVVVGVLASGGCADAKTTWLCRPGLARDPCTPDLTVISANGRRQPIERRPTADCFYVYPTVSRQPGPEADLHVDAAERTVARIQAGRFSQVCRVWAPMYRQITLAGLAHPGSVTPAMLARAYSDVRAAWRTYLAAHSDGRGIVLIGHSQGTFMLRRLVAEEIDPKPAVRRRLLSAILLGGNVTVRAGSDAGGDFKHTRACLSARQLHCVIAYSSFGAMPPANSLFGRAPAGLQVLCTNPAALGGGSGRLTAYFAHAGGWLRYHYRGTCSTAGGANVLMVTPLRGARPLSARPTAAWGLHAFDVNIAVGNLTALVRSEAAAYR
jgi:hypothetical protein